MEENMIKADKKTRIINLVIIIAIVLIAIFLYGYLQRYYLRLNTLAEEHPDQAIMKVVGLVKLIIIANPIITFGFMLYFILLGTKTYKSEQFPPPGTKVVRNTRLILGSKAKKYAYGLWIFAALLVVFVIVITIMLNNLLLTII